MSFNNDFYDTRSCCTERGYLGAVFRRIQGSPEKSEKKNRERVFCQSIILSTDVGEIGLILNF